MVVDEVVGRIDDFAELRQDDLFLALEMLLVEMRAADRSAINSATKSASSGERAAVEDGLVARGPGVERPPTSSITSASSRVSRAAGALEHHMLDEVARGR